MASANFIQTNFLGGEQSPFTQGRMEAQDYRTGMTLARNIVIVEEGAAPRRSGTRLLATTRKGRYARLREFHFEQALSYDMEFTTGHLRFFRPNGLVVEQEHDVGVVSGATPAQVQTGVNHGWATGDAVQFRLPDGQTDVNVTTLLQRQWEITSTGLDTFTLADPVTGAGFDGSTVTLGPVPLYVARVVDYATPWTLAMLDDLRTVQDQDTVFVLAATVKPYALVSITSDDGVTPATFSFGAATFRDGPYADPFKDGSTVTPSGLSGSITLTAAIGGGSALPAFPGFAATDVGRVVRLFSEPLDWSAVTAYAVGDHVKFADGYWTALKANTNKQPDLDVLNWSPSTTNYLWTWGRITAYTSTTQVTVAIEPLVTGEDNVASGPLLYTHSIKTWRLGAFSDTTGWPTAGTYHEGRIWFGLKNGFSASVSNEALRGVINFAPTGRDGTVADNSGITYPFNAAMQENILWMRPTDQGIVFGTAGGEGLIRASAVNDPLTPTSIQAKIVTSYGSKNVEPVTLPLSLGFVNRYGRKTFEYTAMPQPGKFQGTNLSLKGKHLTSSGVEEIAYQQELAPVIWHRMTDGSLAGITYKREDPYGSQPLSFAGWHRHDLGHERLVTSIQTGPSDDGTLDALMLVTHNEDTDVYYVEVLTTLFDQDTDITLAFFVDGGLVPAAAKVVGSNVVLYGLTLLAGEIITVTAGGLDLGDYTVSTTGTVTIPLNSQTTADGLFTSAFLQALTDTGSTFGTLGVTVLPAAAGTGAEPDVTGVWRYKDGSPLTGITNGTAAIDFDGRHAYFAATAGGGGTSSDGLYKMNADTGAIEATKDAVTGGYTVGSWTAFHNGFLYFINDASNSGRLNKASAVDLSLSATFGTASSSFGSDASHMHHPRQMVGFTLGDTDYLLSTSLLGGGGLGSANQLTLVNATAMTFAGNQSLVMETAGICIGRAGQQGALFTQELYAIEKPRVSNTTSDPSSLYRVTVEEGGGFHAGIIGAVHAADVDATWTHFDLIHGLTYDESDGNVIAGFSSSAIVAYSGGSLYSFSQLASFGGHDYRSLVPGNGTNSGNQPDTHPVQWLDLGVSGTPGFYIAKLNTQTAHVMWKVAVNGLQASDDFMPNSRVRYGVYNHLTGVGGSNATRYRINTADGSVTTTTIIHVPNSYFLWDDVTGRLAFYGSFTSGGGAPTGMNGTVTYSNKWGTFGPGTPTGVEGYFSPFTVGYVYYTQGQIVRPINGPETGAVLGPALGKLRRSHQFAALLHNTQGISFGVEFTSLRPGYFKTGGGTTYAQNRLFSGVHQDTLEADSNYDNMTCWQVVRPYPATVLAIGPFIQTQDK